jgi:hypothetical protein
MFYDFIEIGTSDFDTLIQKADNNTKGLSIEPIKYYLDRLPTKKNCIKENVAISDYNGIITIYYVPTDNIIKYNLPKWVRGCNSVNNIHKGVEALLLKQKLDPTSIFVNDNVVVCELSTIIDKYNINGIYYLKIDTEGHDTIILNNYLDTLDSLFKLPHKILFESNKLTNAKDINDIINRLILFGYELVYSNSSDTLVELNINSCRKNNITLYELNINSYRNFSEPINNYFLAKYPDNYNPKIQLPHENTLEGAKEYCVKYGYGGITYQYGRYEVRQGNRLLPCLKLSNVTSWIYL